MNGKIINACESQLPEAERSLKRLEELNPEEKARYTWNHYRRVKREIKSLRACAVQTAKLMESINGLHPELCYEISGLLDAHGNMVDVYLQVMDAKDMPVLVYGSTNWSPVEEDINIPQSKFGPGRVLVKIRFGSMRKMIMTLVHEFAHIKYQAPNLASYLQYYREHYNCNDQGLPFGHLKNDPGNAMIRKELERLAVVMKQKNSGSHPSKNLITRLKQ